MTKCTGTDCKLKLKVFGIGIYLMKYTQRKAIYESMYCGTISIV
jgi:hypothetical protein